AASPGAQTMLRQFFFWAGFLVLVGLMPVFAADEKAEKKPADEKTEKKPTVEPKEEPREKLTSLGEIVGKLQRVEGSQKYITVQVEQSAVVPQINGGSRPSVSYRVQRSHKSIDIVASDDLKVRTIQPP